MAMSCYNKIFVSDIKSPENREISCTGINKSVMKTSVLGAITGIQKFSRKTTFSVDDGSGTLDCVLWHNEPGLMKNLNRLRMELNSVSGSSVMNKDMNATCQSLLSKVEVKEDYIDYIHGDIICCLGVVKFIKGKLLLDIHHHYKVHDVNAETLWIFNVLSCHQKK